jgi:hypothetical protein
MTGALKEAAVAAVPVDRLRDTAGSRAWERLIDAQAHLSELFAETDKVVSFDAGNISANARNSAWKIRIPQVSTDRDGLAARIPALAASRRFGP